MRSGLLPLHRQEDIIVTHELDTRRDRAPNLSAEAAAFHELSAAIVADPGNAVQRFLEIAIALCGAEAAGISLLDGQGADARFRWDTLAGCYAGAVGAAVPRDASPCGLARMKGHTILVSRPGSVFPEFAAIEPAIVEALIVPFYDNGGVFLGTIWVVHTTEKQFCANDRRVMEHLGIQLVLALKLMREQQGRLAARRLVEEARTERTTETGELGHGPLHSSMARRNSALAAEAETLRAEIAERIETGTFLESILASSGDCIKVLDLDGRIQFINQGGVRLLEASDADTLKGRVWPELWQGDREKALAWDGVARAQAGETVRFQGGSPTLRGKERYWDVQLTPVRDAGGGVRHVLSIARDMTEQRRTEEQRELLAGELDHRVKNILAMVVAIAHQTLRPPATMEQASQAFVARLSALGEAQAILTRSTWNSADIRVVIEGALAPHRNGARDERFTLAGPTLELPPSKALSLALAVHELSTNAMKYGALSVDSGRVSVRWTIDRHEGAGTLQVEWRERGGPAVSAPVSRGFGSKLVERALAAEFRGKVRIEFPAAGVVCTLTAPLSALTGSPSAGNDRNTTSDP